jgi:hypothetical protein
MLSVMSRMQSVSSEADALRSTPCIPPNNDTSRGTEGDWYISRVNYYFQMVGRYRSDAHRIRQTPKCMDIVRCASPIGLRETFRGHPPYRAGASGSRGHTPLTQALVAIIDTAFARMVDSIAEGAVLHNATTLGGIVLERLVGKAAAASIWTMTIDRHRVKCMICWRHTLP